MPRASGISQSSSSANNNSSADDRAPLISASDPAESGGGDGATRNSLRGSAIGRQYSGKYADTTGYDSRDPGTRDSVHASDTGVEVHAAPEATLMTTFLNITCNIVGAGVLAIPSALAQSSLGFGVILIFIFQFFSTFSSYVLSVACEYTQYYSQAQLLCHCLAGYADPEYWAAAGEEDAGDGDEDQNESSGELTDTDEVNNATSAKKSINSPKMSKKKSSGLDVNKKKRTTVHQQNSSADYGAMPDDGHDVKNENLVGGGSSRKAIKSNTSTAGSSTPLKDMRGGGGSGFEDRARSDLDKKSAATAASNPTDEEIVQAEEAAIKSQRLVNLVLDMLLGVTYFGYTIVYARVVGDSMKNVSADIGLPGFFQTRVCWLIIAGVVFLILSMRRVFQEMMITSLIGIATILFVILCVCIRFIHPDEDSQPERLSSEIRYWSIDSDFLSAFATLSSAYGYQVNHPSFYQELRDRSPGQMQKPVVTSMTLVAFLYALTGAVGYLSFGPAISDKKMGGDIVNGYANNDILMNVCRVLLFAHFVCVFPLIACAVRQCMHRAFLRIFNLHERADDPDEVFKVPFGIVAFEVVLVVLGAVVLAGVVPGIGIVISLVGCLGGTFALMILPGIVGMYIFPEIGERIAAGDETVTPAVASIDLNNFGGCCKINFSYKTLYWLSVIVLVIGVGATVGGFVVILNGM